MVGNAAERLQADYIVHTLVRKGSNFGRKKPSLSELCIRGNQVFAFFRFAEYIAEGNKIAEALGYRIYFFAFELFYKTTSGQGLTSAVFQDVLRHSPCDLQNSA